jgi:mono/diheme cytochrome c family protein
VFIQHWQSKVATLRCGFILLAASVSPAATVDFSRDIQPLLARNCFACHGPDHHERKADLRLDTPEAATAIRKSGRAIVTGRPADSLLIRRIEHADPDDRMPPADSGKSLSPAQRQLLRDWIEQGANYSGHWAFEQPVKSLASVPPELAATVHNELDRFVVARLATEKLSPAKPADRTTLLRRLALDLVGLPPTPKDIDAFLADKSPQAYEKQVDRLLKSRHFGERFGRLWLDAARYADTDGYEKDKPRTVWFYRDWVINAFNRDLPYNQFIIEQIAGDLLPNPTQDQIVATGFLRNSMLNEEGGIDPEQFRMEAMFDRMDTIGKSVLGLTIQCAQCHDHKYDPLSQKDYYRLFAYLNNDHEAMPVVYTGEQLQSIQSIQSRIRQLETGLRKSLPDWRERIIAWERARHKDPEWIPLDIINIGNNAQRYEAMPDHSLLAGGWSPPRFTANFAHTNHLENITAIQIEVLTDPNLPGGGPGRGYDGNFALSELKLQVAPLTNPQKKAAASFARATSDFDQRETELPARFTDGTKNRRVTGPAALAIDGKNDTAWAADRGPGRRNQATTAIFELKQPIGTKAGNVFLFDLVQMHGGKNGNDYVTKNLGRFRVSATTASPALINPTPPSIQTLLNLRPEKRSTSQWEQIFSHWIATDPEWTDVAKELEGLRDQWPEGTTAYALNARSDVRPTAILKRGDWLKPGEEVLPGIPSFLNQLSPESPRSRLALARWLAADDSPTTARVFVNRVWQACFGNGLVRTPEDFGVQGEPPSHPKLLDWLAVDFMESGWSVKGLIRRIVTSATYRQSSRVTPKLLEIDPYNHLLARGPRFRVDAEIVRDITLAASGLLNPEMGGPGIMVPAPEFLFKPPASYGDFPWFNDTGPDKYRRAVYTYRRRSTPFPSLTVFDAPPGDFSCVSRQRSNTPLQALTTLNEPLFVEAAQALARKTIVDGGAADAQRIKFAFRRCVGRSPALNETETILGLLERQRTRFAKDAENAKLFAGKRPDESPSVDTSELAAWTAVSRVLLNMDETITKE